MLSVGRVVVVVGVFEAGCVSRSRARSVVTHSVYPPISSVVLVLVVDTQHISLCVHKAYSVGCLFFGGPLGGGKVQKSASFWYKT